jgi:hypothetical protein
MGVYLETNDLRGVITGEVPVRRCADCAGTGLSSWMHYCLKERPHDELERLLTPEQAAAFSPSDWPDFSWVELEEDTCDSCKGIGYVCHLWNDE